MNILVKILFLLCLSGAFLQTNGSVVCPRIVGGKNAMVGEFPYQVLWKNDGEIYCGGSIFNASTIITAAHCCKEYDNSLDLRKAEIVAGQINRIKPGGQSRKIESYISHPDFIGLNCDVHGCTGNHFNDICLLTLDSNLDFNDNVTSIELNTEDLSASTCCTVSGWGALHVSQII